MKKIALIVLAIVAALVLMIAAAFISANNRAVSAEEQVSSAAADVQVAEKRRVDLVYNLGGRGEVLPELRGRYADQDYTGSRCCRVR